MSVIGQFALVRHYGVALVLAVLVVSVLCALGNERDTSIVGTLHENARQLPSPPARYRRATGNAGPYAFCVQPGTGLHHAITPAL